MQTVLDGKAITSEAEFHRALAASLGLGGHYGQNLDALWDVMTGDVERPVLLTWQDAEVSRAAMPDAFEAIVAVLKRVEAQDREYGWDERFELKLN